MDLATISQVLNQTYAPAIANQLNDKALLLNKIRKTVGSGKNIAWDVKLARGTGGGSYASGADITTADDNADVEKPAVLNWKRIARPFKVNGDALAAAANAGPAAYSNLFAKQIDDAARNLAIDLAIQVYADGSGNSGLDVDGLGAALANTGTYAGLSRTTYAIWQANVLANAGTPRPLTSTLMQRAETLVFTQSGMTVDIIVTTPAILERYEDMFTSIERTDAANPAYKQGGVEFFYKGIPVVRDNRCPAGCMFFLSLDSMEFEQLPSVPMADGIELVQGQRVLTTADGQVGLQVAIEMLGKTGDAYKGFIKLYGNLKVEYPNRNAVIKDLDGEPA